MTSSIAASYGVRPPPASPYEVDGLDLDVPPHQVGTPVVGDDTRHLARKIDLG
jgi:hypothetical protein